MFFDTEIDSIYLLLYLMTTTMTRMMRTTIPRPRAIIAFLVPPCSGKQDKKQYINQFPQDLWSICILYKD